MGRFKQRYFVEMVVAGLFLVLLIGAGWVVAGGRFVPGTRYSRMRSLQRGLEHLDREMDRRDKLIDDLNGPAQPVEAP